jgi:hypothetical protein
MKPAASTPKAPRPPAPITSPEIKHLSGVAEKTPSKLSNEDIRKLGASVQAHIEPRKNNKNT